MGVAVNMEDEAPSGTDNVVNEFATYEAFLDSQITQTDLYYLEVGEHLIHLSNVRILECLICFDRRMKSWRDNWLN